MEQVSAAQHLVLAARVCNIAAQQLLSILDGQAHPMLAVIVVSSAVELDTVVRPMAIVDNLLITAVTPLLLSHLLQQ